MRKLFFALAFMLMGAFAFANSLLTNYELFVLCENDYYVYFEGELVAKWCEPAPLDDNMKCTGTSHIFVLNKE